MAVPLNPDLPELSKADSILSGVAREYDASYAGLPSFKTVLEGEAMLEVGRRSLRLQPGIFALVGAGQPYRLIIDSAKPVRTLSLFFKDVEHRGAPGLNRNPRCLDLVTDLTTGLHSRDSEQSDAAFYGLAEALATSESSLARNPALDQSLRVGLADARDRLLTEFDRTLDLAALAQSAALSPFHFHRLYRRAFGVAPIAELHARRCEAAMLLLRRDMPVWQVALRVGFADHSAFSRAFRRRFGTSPSRQARE